MFSESKESKYFSCFFCLF